MSMTSSQRRDHSVHLDNQNQPLLNSMPFDLEAGLRGGQACLWTFETDTQTLHLKGDLWGDDLSPAPLNWRKFLAIYFSDATLEIMQRYWVRLARDFPHNVPNLIQVQDQDGRNYLMKGYAQSETEVSGILMDITEDQSLLSETVPKVEGGLPVQGVLHDLLTDGLTGLLNRKGFLRAAQDILQHDGNFDLVVADINRFRRLNEALGHERADKVLEILAQRLSQEFPDHAVLARLGEDEFVVLTERGFPRISERMRGALEQPLAFAGFDIQPSLSMGAMSIEGGDKSLDITELLRRVELAVEVAKAKGAGAVAPYRRDLESDGLTRLALESEVRKAFQSGEIEAYFQPIINIRTDTLAGFEALARWHHPKKGIIPPLDFLGCVADLGMMAELGKLMLAQSCQKLRHWRRHLALNGKTYVSVNLSALEIEDPGLAQSIVATLKLYEIPPHCIKFEVTEGDVMRNPDDAIKVLQNLRDKGVGLALDDFGTGYSSLGYLSRLPIDTVKIDRSFISTLTEDLTSAKIVRAIINLGRDLGLSVVAEGVETRDELRSLIAMGGQFTQGYYYSKPLRAQGVEAYINTLSNKDRAEKD